MTENFDFPQIHSLQQKVEAIIQDHIHLKSIDLEAVELAKNDEGTILCHWLSHNVQHISR